MLKSPRTFTAILKDESGAALMMAIFTVTMLMIIATEIMYETSVELSVSAQTVNQVRAHFSAKAGVEIGLLRLHIYRKVMGMMGESAKQLPMIDMIWQMPFMWPPMVPGEVGAVDRDEIKSTVSKSVMTGQYDSRIESESSKIDLSLLALSGDQGKALVQATLDQLNQIFKDKMESDEAFAKKYTGTDFTKIMINIKDWVDEDDKSDNGGDESQFYADMNLSQTQKLPPNQPFKTYDELHMVAGITDDFFDILLPKVTIYGAKAVNVKYAPADLLKSIFRLNDEQVNQVKTERDKKDTPHFKDPDTFVQYLQSIGVRMEDLVDKDKKLKVPILVEPEFNFRVSAIGVSGKVNRKITAVVYDYDRVLDQLKKMKPSPSPTPAGPTPPGQTPPPAGGTPATQSAKPVPNERPNIVYWNET